MRNMKKWGKGEEGGLKFREGKMLMMSSFGPLGLAALNCS
jgi:hypothetical protein